MVRMGVVEAVARGHGKSEETGLSSSRGLLLKLSGWRGGEKSCRCSGAVKCVDIRRQSSGEGGFLELN